VRPVGAAIGCSIDGQAAACERLRVCADPDDLPYSNAAGEGFENRISLVLAGELGMDVEYTWQAERHGLARDGLKAGLCDVVIGVPAVMDEVLTTNPYYRSVYVFVSARDRALDIRSFDDPRLRDLRVGVQLATGDGLSSPPAHALSGRHIVDNVVGYAASHGYRERAPVSNIVDAVARGDIDVAVVWGPQAAYFAAHAARPLVLTPVQPEVDRLSLPLAFDIAIGVRHGDEELRDRLEAALERRRADIDRILSAYRVPRTEPPLTAAAIPPARGIRVRDAAGDDA
jgi:mxaJ protein